jgi:putative resolvase
MRLHEYAKSVGVCYQTAWRWWKAGKIKGVQMDTRTIIINPNSDVSVSNSMIVTGKVAVYGRVSSSENKSNLETQVQRLLGFAMPRGIKWILS